MKDNKNQYFISEQKSKEKKPFADWFEIFKAVFNLRTDLKVIDIHIHQIITWINEQEDSYERRVSIQLLSELRYALNDIFTRESDKSILEIKDKIASFLPSEEYKPDFMNQFKEK